MSNVDSIKVRMYNTGSVGDCLLLLFQKNKQTTFTMLIDCGGYNTKAATITACVKDIKQTLGGKPLDLVVVTHEHLDHVSGFNQARSVFDDKMVFKQVWMAWTEDKTDPVAKKLKTQLGKKLKALTSSLAVHLTKLKLKSRTQSNISGVNQRNSLYLKNWSTILEALQFESGKSFGKAAAGGLTVANAMEYVKNKSQVKSKNKMFRRPGEVIDDMKGAEGIRFFILGPPYDDDLKGIKDKMEEDEMYSFQKQLAFSGRQIFLTAAENSPQNNEAVSNSPFHKKYLVLKKDKTQFSKMYDSEDMKWRQIEQDWMESSGEVAIAVNSYTNNTSLALAIEFKAGGKVLLFPGDAQSGNWMSWHNPNVKSTLKKNGGRDADDLLAKTVLYKAGHHGSHNGTASKSGLDKMNPLGKEFVVMMPLVQDKVPSQWGGSKNFPAKALYTELIKRANGAIIRTDTGLIDDKRAKDLREKNLSQSFTKKLADATKPLYHEWVVEG